MKDSFTRFILFSVITLLFGCNSNKGIDAYLQRQYQDGKLNGNVLVIKDGNTIYENSFGYTDGSKNSLLDETYKFNIGSVYKEFPAVAIMQLYEVELISLEDKVGKFVPGLPDWSEKVSIKNLLQYSSGLPKIRWNEYFSSGLNPTEDDILKEIKSVKTLEFEPGTDYLYTNSSPILLIKIVENISKMSFDEYLNKNIFIPFKLEDIVLKEQYPYIDKTLMAIPFDSEFKEDSYRMSVKSLLFSATAKDMAKWFEILGNFEIIEKQFVKFLSETAREGDNIQSPLGYCKWENNKIIEHTHHGSSGNYECVVRRFEQEGITIVVLTNQKHGNVFELSDMIFEMLRKDV